MGAYNEGETVGDREGAEAAQVVSEPGVRVDRPPFAMIPEALLYDGTLSPNCVRVYGALLRKGNNPTSCRPSHEYLAKKLGMAVRSVARPLADLEAAGWITKVKRRRLADGSRQTDAYHVHFEPRAILRVTTTRSSAKPPRDLARSHRAESRGKEVRESRDREPSTAIENEAAAGAAARADGQLPGLSASVPQDDETTTRDADLKASWERVCRAAWDARKTRGEPAPATKWVAQLAVAKAVLAAGHSEEAVVAAMAAVPTISIRWVEAELNRGTAKAKPVTHESTWDRSEPSGVMTDEEIWGPANG